MSEEPSASNLEITQLLHQWGSGETEALGQLLPEVYENLRRMAGAQFRGEQPQTLCTSALVNELYVRLATSERIVFKDRNHFFAIAGRMMRRITVEHARKRLTEKRGANLKVTLNEDIDLPGLQIMDLDSLITLGEAIVALEKQHSRAARILEWRIFSGLKFEEISTMLEVSLSTVKREWELAKQHMFLMLRPQ